MNGMSGTSGMDGSSDMSGMDMTMMMKDGIMTEGDCMIQMLGNWRTVNACFLTRSWHISSEAQFAGTCIGVFLIVVLIEMVRRLGREYDRYVATQAFACCRPSTNRPVQTDNASTVSVRKSEDQEKNVTSLGKQDVQTTQHSFNNNPNQLQAFFGNSSSKPNAQAKFKAAQFHPTLIQQAIRSVIYGIQFAGAYIIMLIAMSFNGFILISIVLGGIVGHFVSTWDAFPFQASDVTNNYDDPQLMGLATTPAQPVGVLPEQYNSTSGACCN